MRLLMLAATVASLFTLTGCFDLPSVAPVYTAQSAVAEPHFAGIWLSKDGKEQMFVRQGADSAYRLSYVDDKGEVTAWDVHLVRLGDTLVADLMAAKEDAGIPAHQFMALSVSADTLQARFLDSDALRAKAAKEGLAYVSADKKTVLTAGTAALAEFLKKSLPDELKRDVDLQFSRVR